MPARPPHRPRPSRAAWLAAPILLAGCATIFTGTTDVLTFDANVPGVRLSIDGELQGTLPLTVTISRSFVGGRQFFAKFEKAGYSPQEFPLHRELNLAAIPDITSIPTSGGIDVLTGALMRFEPTAYHVQMLRAGASARDPEFQRSVAIHQLGLGAWRAIQRDVARGGGEALDALCVAFTGGDRGAAATCAAEALRSAPALLAATTAHDLLARMDGVIGADPALRRWRL
jgi:hypothetical protein